MTRKDYVLLAEALHRARVRGASTATDAWTACVREIADALTEDSGFDLNGNRRFDRDRFERAARGER